MVILNSAQWRNFFIKYESAKTLWRSTLVRTHTCPADLWRYRDACVMYTADFIQRTSSSSSPQRNPAHPLMRSSCDLTSARITQIFIWLGGHVPPNELLDQNELFDKLFDTSGRKVCITKLLLPSSSRAATLQTCGACQGTEGLWEIFFLSHSSSTETINWSLELLVWGSQSNTPQANALPSYSNNRLLHNSALAYCSDKVRIKGM